MYKRILPVFILSGLLISCGSQQQSSESTASADSLAADIPADSAENGNTDGDIFVTEELKRVVNGEDTQDTTADEEEEEDEMARVSVDDALHEVNGFSPDGKYFAFVQVERGDGYSDPDGNVYIIEVARNEWATKPGNYTDDRESEKDFDTELNKVRDALLKKYGITGKNLGTQYGPNDPITINGVKYTLDFKSDNGMIDLRLKGQGKEIVLQKDNKVPASRGAVRDIRVSRAYVLGDKIAVFVEYDGPIQEGFESYRYFVRKNIVVTGVVK